MTIPEMLKIIRQLSGLPQEKLAQTFGVSFPTFNKWINGKSIPHPKTSAHIEDVYLEYTGQKKIPVEKLAAQKQHIMAKSREHGDVLKTILDNPDIYNQFMLSLTYHTNRIEGSTLSEAQTAAVLFENSVFPDKSLIEHLEVKNHQAALDYLLNYMASKPRLLDEQLILTLHGKLMNSIRPDAGWYRRHSVRIVGVDVPTANYLSIPVLMNALVENIAAQSPSDIIAPIVEIHSRFEQIHPFSDGNGRIGRLLIHAMALRWNLPPAVIRQEQKGLYYTYLAKAQQSQHQDLSLLEDFLCHAFLEGFRILERK